MKIKIYSSTLNVKIEYNKELVLSNFYDTGMIIYEKFKLLFMQIYNIDDLCNS